MAVDDDIQEIRKEIVESHNLIIKTDNLIKNLSVDIRNIQKKQERYERKYIFNSVAAYIIFVVVIFGGLYVAFEAKVSVIRREKDDFQQQADKFKAMADELQSKFTFRAQQEKAAERFLKLRKENRNVDALKAAENFDPQILSPLLANLVTNDVEDLRNRMGQEAFDAAKGLFQKGQLEKSLRELERAFEMKPPAPLLAKLYLQQGLTLIKLNRNAQAAKAFQKAVDTDPSASNVDYLLFLAAGAFETSGNVPLALEMYKRLVNEHGESPYASQGKHRIAKLDTGGPTETERPSDLERSRGLENPSGDKKSDVLRPPAD